LCIFSGLNMEFMVQLEGKNRSNSQLAAWTHLSHGCVMGPFPGIMSAVEDGAKYFSRNSNARNIPHLLYPQNYYKTYTKIYFSNLVLGTEHGFHVVHFHFHLPTSSLAPLARLPLKYCPADLRSSFCPAPAHATFVWYVQNPLCTAPSPTR
jgi:hypothetical protein